MRLLAIIAISVAFGYALNTDDPSDPWLYTEQAGERWCLVAQHQRVTGASYPGREVYMVDIDGDWVRVFERCE